MAGLARIEEQLREAIKDARRCGLQIMPGSFHVVWISSERQWRADEFGWICPLAALLLAEQPVPLGTDPYEGLAALGIPSLWTDGFCDAFDGYLQRVSFGLYVQGYSLGARLHVDCLSGRC